MSDKSKIHWTQATWNPVVGCSYASEGCRNCYAVKMTRRLEAMGKSDYTVLTTERHFNGRVHVLHHKLDVPIKWNRPRMIFVNSMSDLFHPKVPFEFIDKVFAVMAMCQQHKFQILTKRPERMAEYLLSREAIDNSCRVDRSPQWYHEVTMMLDQGSSGMLKGKWDACHYSASKLDPTLPIPNVWLGTSVEDQATADDRIPHLLKCPAAVRWLSVEPMLGSIIINLDDLRRMQWVVCGGESGPNARPFDVMWADDLLAQCRLAGVPFFMKQYGSRPRIGAAIEIHLKSRNGGDMSEWTAEHLRVREYPKD